MRIVDVRINYFKDHFTLHNKDKNSVTRIKQKLKEIGKDFVFVQADKAANNIVVV